jgi:histidinol-phosphatase
MPASWSTLRDRAWTARAFGDFWQHCLVAEGAVDVATDEFLYLWDYAAVQLLVEEAGGRCSTFGGTAPEPGGSLVSTNSRLHDTALALLGV